MRRRVLFLIPVLKIGGAERVVVRLLRMLSRERFDLHLGVVQSGGELLPEVPQDVELHDLGARRVRFAGPGLVRLVRRLRPAVLVSNLNYLNLAVAALRSLFPRETRVILQETTVLSAHLAEMRRGRLLARAYRALYPRADLVLACSHAMLEDLARAFGLPRERLRYVPNPIDVERIGAALAGAPSPFPGPGPHVLGVGRLAPEKGYDRLVEAFAHVAVRHPAHRLWILGEGSERPRLEVALRARGLEGRATLAGFVPDPFPWMRHADVFVQSSRREGLPVAVLEAAACGARIAAFDCPGGTGEILREIEGSALVPDGDVEGLAAAIERLTGPDAPPRSTLPAAYRPEAVVESYTGLLLED